MTSVLIIGKTGQVGRELIEASWPQGWRVTGTDRTDIDLARPDTIASTLDRHAPDVVINAAAYTAVDRAETEPDAAFAVNASGVAALGREAAARDIPVLHISTDYVFDGSGDEPWREDDATAPLNIYGASKRAGEIALAAAHPHAMILRTSWVYGTHGNNFVTTMLRLARDRPEIRIVDDQHGAPTDARDIAAALVRMAHHALRTRDGTSAPAWGTYHFAAGGETTWHGFADTIFAELERRTGARPRSVPIPSSAYPTPARRPLNSRLNCTKFDATFGGTRAPWQHGVSRVLAALI